MFDHAVKLREVQLINLRDLKVALTQKWMNYSIKKE